jgi:hypothetical protein
MSSFPRLRKRPHDKCNYAIVVVGGLMTLAIPWCHRPAYGGVHWFNEPISKFIPTIRGESKDENSIDKKGRHYEDLSVPAMDA